MPFGLANAPMEFQKRMEDIFRNHPWILVYIDDILICAKSMQERLKQLQISYELVYHHGLVLSKPKMEIGKTEIEFLGLKIRKGKFVLKDHILKIFKKFPDVITDKTQLWRFIGSLNYIRPFYRGQAEYIHILQQRLKKNPP